MYGRVRSLEESIRVATFHEAVCGLWCTVLKGHVKRLRALRDDYKGHCETLEAKRHHLINIRSCATHIISKCAENIFN